MDPLATVEDLAAYGIVVADEEADLVAVFLRDASEAIRSAATVAISRTTSTVALTAWGGDRLPLPGGPVTDVASVTIDGTSVPDAVPVDQSALWRLAGWGTPRVPATVRVTYTHGYVTVPADIINMTCSMAAAALVAHRDQVAVGADGAAALASRDTSIFSESVSIDDFSATTTYQQQGGTLAVQTKFTLPEATIARLEARFGGSAVDTVVTR